MTEIRGVLCNVTVNQKHIQAYKPLLETCIKKKWIKGLGISLTDSSNTKDLNLITELTQLSRNNVVIHVIAGILKPTDVKALFNRKVLILGYKNNVGRGVPFFKEHSNEIFMNTKWLAANLKKFSRMFQVTSFDNLALAQLDARNQLQLSDAEWALRFQGKDYGDAKGKDAPSTFYYDAINQMIGRSSTQPHSERIPYTGQTFEEAFQASLSNYEVNEDSEYGEIPS